MKITDTIRRAGRSLRQAKARTLLTSLAIGVGAFTITLALAAGAGGRQYATDIVSSNANPRELYVQPKQNKNLDPTAPQEYTEGPAMQYGGGFSAKLLSKKDIEKLAKLAKVDKVTPIYNASVKYITRDGAKKYQAGADVFNSAIKQDILAGDTSKLDDKSLILPSNFVNTLGFSSAQSAVGQTINIVLQNATTGEEHTYRLNVVAVAKSSLLSATGGMSLMVSQPTMAAMYSFTQKGTPLEDAYAGAIVLATGENDVTAVKAAIKKAGYSGQSAEDLMGFLFNFINVLMGILIGFGALAVLTSVFGIINTQYISVLERTQQIGLMKALGMRRRDVGRLFKLEAAWIGFLGGTLGSGTALLAGTVANPIISDVLSLGNSHLLIFQPWSFAVVIGGLMLVAVVSGILPARKASKLDPIEALRTE